MISRSISWERPFPRSSNTAIAAGDSVILMRGLFSPTAFGGRPRFDRLGWLTMNVSCALNGPPLRTAISGAFGARRWLNVNVSRSCFSARVDKVGFKASPPNKGSAPALPFHLQAQRRCNLLRSVTSVDDSRNINAVPDRPVTPPRQLHLMSDPASATIEHAPDNLSAVC